MIKQIIPCTKPLYKNCIDDEGNNWSEPIQGFALITEKQPTTGNIIEYIEPFSIFEDGSDSINDCTKYFISERQYYKAYENELRTAQEVPVQEQKFNKNILTMVLALIGIAFGIIGLFF
ncbi:hypothetical protein FDE76_15585 [Clostridium botulinum]|uniref:Uncharacterized protein n=1 Tax=Clostridium botulinum (strain Eklund 17B / Type B) TaxID=935198 RepID=B2TM24_CLOBB|nr:hypothetical protein CLL_A1947 [Clostridium botulinum B str. Eklund 17B (NRP)]MBY6977095.1 hypothetical protein [Clostridium botulinum]MBY6999253.1 hypothetical protein [Clostridium botulinum]MCR1272666.1 hypothetical protein [Clostridium botulinum]NFD69965.1 hypothetical protein [Clostridium botulinum]